MKKVILTGVTGLIGSNAVTPLQDKGFEVYGLSNTPNPQANYHHIECNIFDTNTINQIFSEIKASHLLHFAWDTRPGIYLDSESNFDWLVASMNMLKSFQENGGQKAVFAGTCFEYLFHNQAIKESDATNPTTIYAKCKNQLHYLAELYAEKMNLNFGWGRIFYVFGQNEHPKRLFPYLINSLKNNEPVNIKSSHLIKDYMFASDIAKAFVTFLDSEVTGTVNICTNQETSLKKVGTIIADLLGKQELLNLEEISNNEPPKIVGDNTRLVKEIGFNDFTSLEDALKLLI